jgi:hypothetical protein
VQINIKKTVKVLSFEATGGEWQIYSYRPNDSDPLYRDQAHYDEVVAKLNKAVLRAAKSTKTRSEFIDKAEKTLYRLRRYGAADTEPRGLLYDIATRIYGPEEFNRD